MNSWNYNHIKKHLFKEVYHEEYNAAYSGDSQPTSWRNILSPSSDAVTCFLLASCLYDPSTLKMEAICSSGTMVDFHWTTQHYISEDITFQHHLCENLESNIISYSYLLVQ
jgi:hypothetical protein